jgi:predicted enzyme related to lactoylglutathione lyase
VATVVETFFSVEVDDMQRATAFYVGALGATVKFATPRWTSIYLAEVRIGLFANPGHAHGRIGLHFVVDDLEAAFAAVTQHGGSIVSPPLEAAPGVVVAEVADPEGNTFTLRRL